SRFNALASSVILGFFWWLWHLPAVFIPGRFMADSLPVFLALAAVIMLTSVLFTWVYNNTDGSVLAALLMHTAMNWSIWIAMPGMRMDLPTVAFMIGFLAVAVIIVVEVSGAVHLRRAPADVEMSV
ncbi:MAG: CPBP family glutamic-type intramembrane protease, partial [Anaerolineae bacterium]|nr:CPBP family glutamic-type intramembrane protease [Candidatus Roseilinea sp.]MDW8448729.1 CPBP family glutamic-type intramembrane protease [Anaerolineae bacterium]